MEGAREIISILNKKYKLKIDVTGFDDEIKEMETELMKKTKEMDDVQKNSTLNKLKSKLINETSYIG